MHSTTSSVRIRDKEYNVNSGNGCMKAPCQPNTLPEQLMARSIDSIGIWGSISVYTAEEGMSLLLNSACEISVRML